MFSLRKSYVVFFDAEILKIAKQEEEMLSQGKYEQIQLKMFANLLKSTTRIFDE